MNQVSSLLGLTGAWGKALKILSYYKGDTRDNRQKLSNSVNVLNFFPRMSIKNDKAFTRRKKMSKSSASIAIPFETACEFSVSTACCQLYDVVLNLWCEVKANTVGVAESRAEVECNSV